MQRYSFLGLALTFTLFSCGTTEAQVAHFSSFSYEGKDARFETPINPTAEFYNPILAGYAPDPSMCRVGEYYYLVNSSFTAYPGVPIYKSKDLVNWKSIGHVLDRESQLPLKGQNVSGGIFAPAITYNAKNKTFYMVTTNVGWGNFYVKSKNPEEGWSEPIRLPHVGGIDPSFYFDKNGRGYIVNNDEPVGGHDYEGQRSIFLHYFDAEGDSTYGEQIEILRGGTHVQEHPIWIEGPHMFKNGKYYYLMCAEGGTCDWHSEVILRATKPEGPWEECPHNPILTQRDLPGRSASTYKGEQAYDVVTSAGHADIVEDGKGNWWACFLGCRPYEGDMYNTGRDTYLLPVTWKDGWPTILEQGKPVPTVVKKDQLDYTVGLNLTGNFSYTDRFDQETLNVRWMTLRNPEGNYLKVGKGLDLTAKPVSIAEKGNPAAVFARQQHTNFTAETEFNFEPKTEEDLAGMVLLQKETHNIVFGKTLRHGKTVITLTRTEGQAVTIASAEIPSQTAVRLKVTGRGRWYDFWFAVGDAPYQPLCLGVDASCLSTQRSGGFIGACIGLYATSKKSATVQPRRPRN